MQLKIMISVMATVLALGINNEADGQWCGPRRGGFYRGGFHRAPRVAIVLPPRVRYAPPPPYYYGPRFPRHRRLAVCDYGHRGCNDRLCYDDRRPRGYNRERDDYRFDRGERRENDQDEERNSDNYNERY